LGNDSTQTDTTDFRPRQLVTDLFGTCCGETDVMDFGLKVFHNMDVRTLERSVDEIID